MGKYIWIIISLFILMGCKNKEEIKITFIFPLSIGFTITENGTYPLISAVVEYSQEKDSLLIALNKNRDSDSILSDYGLSNFYKYPINIELQKKLNLILKNSENYKSEYLSERSHYKDERGMKTIIIKKNNNIKTINHNSSETPYEFLLVDSLLLQIIKSKYLQNSKDTISFETIKQWEDTTRIRYEIFNMKFY